MNPFMQKAGINPMQMMLQRAMSDPRIQNNPQMQEIVKVLQSGDQVAGETLARNYIQSLGMDQETATQQAQGFLQQNFRF